MQKTIYACDECKKEIGNKKHITLIFGSSMNASGIAYPPVVHSEDAEQLRWKVEHSLKGQFVHFCNGQCIGRFFAKLLKKEAIPF